MRLIFLGSPGSGKGTQTQLLAQRWGLTTIATGELLRAAVHDNTPAGQRAQPFVASGQLVPDDLVNDIVAHHFRDGAPPKCFILDGYPRTVGQAKAFDQVLDETKLSLDAVISLSVPDEEIIRRLSGRGRDDDRRDILRKRLEIFHAQNQAVVDYYRPRGLVVDITAVGEVETVYAAIDRALAARKKGS